MDFELCDEWFKQQMVYTKINVGETICIPNHPKYHLLSLQKNEVIEQEMEKKEDIEHQERIIQNKITPSEFYNNFVQCSEEECQRISSYPQRSKEWINSRKFCITASDFGTVNGENPYESVNVLLRKKVFESFKGNEFTEYGKVNENNARDCFLDWYKYVDANGNFREVNLIKYADTPWMAVSPDGLIDTMDNQVDLVEFKCPARIKDSDEHPYAKYPLNTPSYYYSQIQGIAGYLIDHGIKIRHIWFVVWQPKRTFITMHKFDENYYRSMFTKLRSFYFDQLLILLTKKYNNEVHLVKKGSRSVLENISSS